MIVVFFLVFIPTLLSADNGKRNHSYIGELAEHYIRIENKQKCLF